MLRVKVAAGLSGFWRRYGQCRPLLKDNIGWFIIYIFKIFCKVPLIILWSLLSESDNFGPCTFQKDWFWVLERTFHNSNLVPELLENVTFGPWGFWRALRLLEMVFPNSEWHEVRTVGLRMGFSTTPRPQLKLPEISLKDEIVWGKFLKYVGLSRKLYFHDPVIFRNHGRLTV